VKGASLMKRWGFQAIPMPASPQVMPYLCHPENRWDVERGHEIQFRSPDGPFFVDLHWQLGDRFWRFFGPDIDKPQDRAVRQDLPKGSISTPCREDLFWHSAPTEPGIDGCISGGSWTWPNSYAGPRSWTGHVLKK